MYIHIRTYLFSHMLKLHTYVRTTCVCTCVCDVCTSMYIRTYVHIRIPVFPQTKIMGGVRTRSNQLFKKKNMAVSAAGCLAF